MKRTLQKKAWLNIIKTSAQKLLARNCLNMVRNNHNDKYKGIAQGIEMDVVVVIVVIIVVIIIFFLYLASLRKLGWGCTWVYGFYDFFQCVF